jgi:hypothetical protein
LDKLEHKHCTIIAGSADGALNLWSPSKSGSSNSVLGWKTFHESSVTAVATTASRIYSGDMCGVIIIWGVIPKGKENLNSDKDGLENDDLAASIIPIRTIGTQLENISELTCSNRSLFIMSEHLSIYDLTSQRLVPTKFVPSGNGLQGMCLSPDGSLVAACDEFYVYIWGAYDGKLREAHPLPISEHVKSEGSISCLHWNRTKHMLVFCRTGCDFPILLFGNEA